ncbi:hypothetical protein MNB_SV-12-787 [hydrothermal vent metagenome]|uniref:Uncharacterized protein n=1 Tax=hydrothermal vent metagenome TaxID=652676 RepID=A0A1W1BDP7_9ZZZZ
MTIFRGLKEFVDSHFKKVIHTPITTLITISIKIERNNNKK